MGLGSGSSTDCRVQHMAVGVSVRWGWWCISLIGGVSGILSVEDYSSGESEGGAVVRTEHHSLLQPVCAADF